MNDGLLFKVIPPRGRTYRFHLGPARLGALAAAVVAIAVSLVFAYFAQLHAANADVISLRAQHLAEQRRIDEMERQEQRLGRQTAESQRTIEAIRRQLDTRSAPRSHAAAPVARELRTLALGQRLDQLQTAATETRRQAGGLQRLAARVLNFRRLASIARGRMIAAIPSLNPVNGAINAAFGYRTNPFPEFHKGLDLAADYGTPVRAAAAGTVAGAGWEGGYGIKIDLDHGNGYHTWYCHLSHAAVAVGQRVAKGEAIAAVGSTGESTGPHLHYQVMLDGVAIDPMPFLHGIPRNVLASLPDDSGVR